MHATTRRIAAALVASVVAAGCATQKDPTADMSGTQKGALAGGVLGGLFGAAVGGDSKGALTGVLAGAVIGAIVGHYQDKQTASREEAARRYALESQPRLEVESAVNAPNRVGRGGTVESRVGYTVLAPAAGQEMRLVEERTLVRGQDSFALSRREVARAQGSHASVFKFTLPKDLEAGEYTLVTTVSQGALVKTVRAPLTVA